jgi:N-acyl-phosphatidylethanolamine-hydrolysing phospholipase D
MLNWHLSAVKYAYVAIINIALLLFFNNSLAQSDLTSKAHHTPTGFKNNYAQQVNKSFGDFLRWRWAALGLDTAPKTPTPLVEPDLALIYNASAGSYLPTSLALHAPTVTWIGHATALVQANGLNVLLDPIFSERASPVQIFGPKRAQPPGVAMADLPHIDVVLISHNHYDHLDRISVAQLDEKAKAAGKTTLFIVPLGLKAWFNGIGIDSVVELDWWQHHDIKGVEFHLTPVQHWSARSINDRSATLWGGWAVLGADFHWYYAGDTGYSRDFADTAKHFAPRQTEALGGGFDLALVPVGAYEPRWFMSQQHVNPMESVRIHQDVGAKRSIGVHWGTFALTDEPLDQPPRDLAVARQALGVKDTDFGVLAVGESRQFAKRAASTSLAAR